ncbi:MAG: class I SAM-dependent methyltransferase [Marmoricola sp.]
MADSWTEGDAYEQYMGRWSRLVAPRFVRWLQVAPELRWVDVGCGTGALTTTVLQLASPTAVVALDPSAGFVEEARRRAVDPRAEFRVGTAEEVPADVADVAVSGLVLNFVPDPDAAVRAMAAAVGHGTVAAYVWDYGGRMQLLRTFWDVACALDVTAIDLDEAQRFPLCEPPALVDLWERVGLGEVRTASIEVTTDFEDFDDLWQPFLGGTGPAPTYVGTLDTAARERLREAMARMVHPEPDGRIRMHARAWAVRGEAA